MINPTPRACSVLFAQSPTCALSSKYEGDVFGVAAAAVAPSSTPASLLEGITCFILVINAFLIGGLKIPDELVLSPGYTSFSSLLPH